MRNFLVGVVAASVVTAAGAAGACAADLSHLGAMAGQYTDVILADPALDAELRANLGAGYDDFMGAMQVVVPSELIDGQFLVLSGCMQHDCDAHRGKVIVDLQGGGIQVLRSDLYGAYLATTPAVDAAIDAWSH